MNVFFIGESQLLGTVVRVLRCAAARASRPPPPRRAPPRAARRLRCWPCCCRYAVCLLCCACWQPDRRLRWAAHVGTGRGAWYMRWWRTVGWSAGVRRVSALLACARHSGCVAVPVCLALCTAPALADWMGWGVVHVAVPYSGVVCGCANGGCVSCMCAARWGGRRSGCVAVPVCLALCTAPALADWMGWGVVHAAQWRCRRC